MDFTEISILVRLLLGALATFFGIFLWSKTRDSAWILVVLGTLVSYAEIIFSTLEKFGILKMESRSFLGLPELPVEQLIQILLINLPLILFTIAFIVMIARRRL
jgi:hypothetical protein